MIINNSEKQVLMERRDIDYILPQYIRSYLYYTKNQDPEEIVCPMFHSVRHPLKPTVMVPIRWVPELDILAQEIEADGSSVPEATEAQVAKADEKDEVIRQLREEIANLLGTPSDHPEIIPPAPSAERLPRQPEHPASGSPDEMHPRIKDDLKQTKADLRPEADIDESKQKPYDKRVKRGAGGEPVVEE